MLRRYEKRTRALTKAHDRKIKRLEIRASELRSRLLIRDATIREFLESNSWRVTTPLRSLSRGAGWTRRKTRQALRLLFWIGTGQFSRASAAMRTDIHEVVNLARQGRDTPPDPRAAYVSELVAKCGKNNERMAAAIDAQHAGGQKPGTSISVIAWDVAHNPLGRAYLLADALRKEYDVELIGATFPRFGNEIWEPLRTGSRVTIKSFPGDNFPGHFQSMEDIAKQIEGDVILVSKPRLPSLELAILAKMHRNRPIILDVDDYELGFFGNRQPLTLAEIRAGGRQLNTDCPHDEVWTRYSESLIPLFEQITVSNDELQRKYGGMVLPHIRDADDFDPAIYPREEIRAGLGFSPEDRVILFAGTPRAHKGYERTIVALNKLNRGNYKFLLVGSPMDRASRRFIENIDDDNITILPNVAFRDLPGYLCASDLICLLQDESDVAAHFQMPAKFTDALSMGIPLLATNVPPLVNVAKAGLVELLNDVPLEERIDGIFGNYDTHKRAAVRNRKAFLDKYSYTAVVPRVKEVIDRILRNPAPIPDEFRELLSHHRELYSNERGPPRTTLTVVGANRPDRDDWPADATTANSMVYFRGRKDRSYVDDKLDIVFFWKQNDSGIYGRRQDMLVKYLAMEPRVHRIFHFDAPMNILRSGGTATRTGGVSRHSHARLVLLNTLRRRYFRGRWAKVRRDTYTFLVGRRAPGFIKRFLPSEDGYIQYLANVFRRHAVGERAVVFWVCPNDFHFPAIERRFRPDLVVADVIDDQRKWDIPDRYERQLHQNYREILGRSHLAFANCQSVLRSMEEFSGNVHLLPNAAEFLEKEWGSWKKPPELVRMNGPIVGYVGNLDVTRIDVDLMVAVAKARPDWNLVLIGSMHRGREIRRLNEFRNVHFLGVRMYDKAIRYIRHFDVAMIPHLDNKLTRSMNPLKLYVYFALHIPVVATPIANIDDFSEFVKVGRTPEEFINQILNCMDNDPTSGDHARLRELLDVNSWRKRVGRILELMDIAFLDSDQEVPAVIGKPTSKHADANRVQLDGYSGICAVCGHQSYFRNDKSIASVRENYRCGSCMASFRYREQASLIVKYYSREESKHLSELSKEEEFRSLRIYEPGMIGPFRKIFRKFPNYYTSYFWTDIPQGKSFRGVQCEDLTKLTYLDDYFDLVLSSDIFEHVRKPFDGFKEIDRVLKPGGSHIFSIPVTQPIRAKTTFRVDTSGAEDVFVMPAHYHSAPGGGTSLVYTDFGADIVDITENHGIELRMEAPSLGDCPEVLRGKMVTFFWKKKAQVGINKMQLI